MAVVHCAYTEQINPQGATPILTKDQIWKGLQRKIRKAQDFIPVIDSCKVLEEKENEIVREIHFKDSIKQPAHYVKEVCKSYYPTKVEFWQPNGALFINTVSDGPGLTENDYNMTYTFEWRYPNITEGSQDHKDAQKNEIEAAKRAVHSSIEAMRKMASAGELD